MFGTRALNMLRIVLFVFHLGLLLSARCVCASSEFSLQGDYLLGGLFPHHVVLQPPSKSSLMALDCSQQSFSLSGYQKSQVMKFAVEQINNSTVILPNVSLGYEIFDYCSDIDNLPLVLDILSVNGSIKSQRLLSDRQSKVIGFTGPLGSAKTETIAPLFMMNLIPMVTYGASSSAFGNKMKYPSFLRTVPSNKDLIQVIVRTIQWFGWNWVAFIGSNNAYSKDGQHLFYRDIGQVGICLAYQEMLDDSSNFTHTLRTIDMLKINVIVVFTSLPHAEKLIRSAIESKIREKVWIAGETWSMNQQIPKEPGIERIGTIMGITERFLTLPGFRDFIYKLKQSCEDKYWEYDSRLPQSQRLNCEEASINCSGLNPEHIVNEDPTFTFSIYSAVYTMAHGLHKALKCEANGCDKSKVVRPFMLLQEMKGLDFPLQDRQVIFDKNGDPSTRYAVVLWPHFQRIGTYDTYPSTRFTINNSLVPWYNSGSVPFSNCSVECAPGYAKEKEGYHMCCFNCKICPPNTSINSTSDPYKCEACHESEWSDEGGVSCLNRSQHSLSKPLSIFLILSSTSLIAMSTAIMILFAYNYNTPVVRSAGGNMCFLMLACLIASGTCTFSYLGTPSKAKCAMEIFPFVIFHTICLSCLTVRAFQIICAFKMASKYPKEYSWWVKYNGQWLFIAAVSVIQVTLCAICICSGIKLYKDLTSVKDHIILLCQIGTTSSISMVIVFMGMVAFLCFSFSYMGKDLPKNYNGARSITFCLFLFYLTFIVSVTAYFVLSATAKEFIKAMAVLCNLYNILFCYFIPKCFIIIFQPQKNTQEYFQNAIQNYTQTISKM